MNTRHKLNRKTTTTIINGIMNNSNWNGTVFWWSSGSMFWLQFCKCYYNCKCSLHLPATKVYFDSLYFHRSLISNKCFYMSMTVSLASIFNCIVTLLYHSIEEMKNKELWNFVFYNNKLIRWTATTWWEMRSLCMSHDSVKDCSFHIIKTLRKLFALIRNQLPLSESQLTDEPHCDLMKH